MKTLIISPTYNESKNVPILLDKLFTINPFYHVLIIDDNSPDGTGDLVESLQKTYPNLHLERRPEKAGLGTAYCFGFKWAIEQEYDIIVQIDADMSHDPLEIPKMIALLENYDYVVGSRYCDGISVVRWPLRRLALSYGANIYSRIVTGMPIKDGTGGFKAWRREVLAAIDLDKVRSQGYSFQIEMNFRAWMKGYRVIEHPIIFIDRTIGESKMNKMIMLEAIWMVWRFRLWKILRKVK